MSDDVWHELKAGGNIAAPRRELQRDYINRIALALVRPAPGGRVDARGWVRVQARSLLARLQALQRKPGKSDEPTRAHVADAIDTLQQSLTATLQRQAL